MFKIFAIAFWALFFVLAFRFVYVRILKDILRKELRNEDDTQE